MLNNEKILAVIKLYLSEGVATVLMYETHSTCVACSSQLGLGSADMPSGIWKAGWILK